MPKDGIISYMLKSFGYAVDGIVWSFKHHITFRIYIAFAVLAYLSAVILKVTAGDFIIITFTVSLCLVAEMVNTCIEEVTDLITVKWAHQAKIAKDVAAGMSFITATTSVIIGISIFTPYIMALV